MEAIRTSKHSRLGFEPSVELRIITGTNGAVLSATPVQGPQEFFDAATSLAKRRRYKPFVRNGRAVAAEFTDWVFILPPERRAARTKAFPRINDWNSLRIILERTGCLGMCPIYRIEIHGDGTVLYRGGRFVALEGEHRDHISQEAVRTLVDRFRTADYFSLLDKYASGVTDNPTCMTSISFDKSRKSVEDYVGLQVGMPLTVSELENSIDRLSDSEKWTIGTKDTAASLVHEGWDFKSFVDTQTSLAANIARYGDPDALRAVLTAGAPAKSYEQDTKDSALCIAAARGDDEMVRLLLDAGAGAYDSDELARALFQGVGTGNLKLTEQLLNKGAKPDYRDNRGETVLMNAAYSGVPEVVRHILKYRPDVNEKAGNAETALMRAVDGTQPSTYRATFGTEDWKSVVVLLLDAGADVHARDARGNTALILSAWDAGTAEALIAGGADVNAEDNDGLSALMNCVNYDVLRVLLRAGADPLLRNKKGENAIENARKFGDMKKVAILQAWPTCKNAPDRCAS